MERAIKLLRSNYRKLSSNTLFSGDKLTFLAISAIMLAAAPWRRGFPNIARTIHGHIRQGAHGR